MPCKPRKGDESTVAGRFWNVCGMSAQEDIDAALEQILAAKGLAISFSAEKGRCLVAARHYSRGEVLLEQEPYVSVLDAESKVARCDSCFKKPTTLMRCSACKNVWYCSSACQRRDWKLHRIECEAIRRLWKEKSQTPTPSLCLMVRLLWRQKLQEDKVIPRTAVDNYELVTALPNHMSKIGEERLVLFAQMANLVKVIGVPDDVDVKSITENFCRFACNAHTICDEELRPLGTGLYPLISVVNHSCSPNLVLLFEGKRAVLRAVEHIEKGSELTVSYVELGANTPSRRKSLIDQYFFQCKCLRCSSSDGSVEDAVLEGYRCSDMKCAGVLCLSPDGGTYSCNLCGAERLREDLQKFASSSEKLLQLAATLGNMKEARKVYENAEKDQIKVWHKNSVLLMRTWDSLLKVCMEMEDWQSALHYAKLTLPTYERIYPPFFPLLGLQLYCLGKLEWFLGNTSKAVAALGRAGDILVVTHGAHSELFQGLRHLLDEASAEAAHKLRQ